jgi:hypothetical protein
VDGSGTGGGGELLGSTTDKITSSLAQLGAQ